MPHTVNRNGFVPTGLFVTLLILMGSMALASDELASSQPQPSDWEKTTETWFEDLEQGRTIRVYNPHGNVYSRFGGYEPRVEILGTIQRLDDRDLPAHGGPITEAAAKVDEYVEHRLWREQRVFDALAGRGEATAADLVAPVYSDVHPRLFPLATRSLTAHLIKLANDGRIRRNGDRWVV